MKDKIIKNFSEHGIFLQPDSIEYILSKSNPIEFTSFIIKNLKECPLVLTIDHIKQLENKKIEETKHIVEERFGAKETERIKDLQTKMFSMIYKREKTISEEFEDNGFDVDKEDQLYLQETEEESEKEEILSTIEIKTVKGWKPIARDYEAEIEIIKDVTGKSLCEGTTEDFAKLFFDRYCTLKKIIRSQRREVSNVVPINRIKRNSTGEINVIGIVKEVRTTANGNRLIEIEDETGSISCIALKNDKQVLQIANEVVYDEVIGIRGQISKNGDLLIIKSIIYPEISTQKEYHRADVPLYVAFLSDIHIGSKHFMQDEWNNFLRWINGQVGNSRQRDVAGRIKYIVIPGDTVDGIGIYPDQERELSISDVYRQYEALASQLRLIPKHIHIIIQPGNHDAVRPAEPQPAFEKEIQSLFSGINITFVGNPCYFTIHGVEILSYHGQSMLDYATNIQHLKYNEPVEIMKVMLRKNHLAPIYGGYTPLAPEHKDYMIIDRIPDIFVTGHVHLAQTSEYRGIKLINASSWQSQTSYQKMLNFIPDSCKLPIVDLSTGNVTLVDFNKKFS